MRMYGVSVGYECPLGEAFLVDAAAEVYEVSINMTCGWYGDWTASQPEAMLNNCERKASVWKELETV